ncbi:hypothetical protein H206_00019 [Candidatus Electrothrix aarhusensis]|uniref:Tex-like central region domain-containing protein n=1 Tax=Candidatus Electrothrix aarhusensis TaxID=1859131 RepID=A0A3S3QYV6_9BACT|nr:hypothetical protein H206_00019 [Candidatus Electrothrix aarhusensis]
MRAELRRFFADKAVIHSAVVKKKQEEGAKFQDYFDWQEAANKVPSHRLLAMFRGGAEKMLRLAVRPDEDAALALLKRKFSSQGRFREQLSLAGEESYKRLLGPSLENELRAELKQRLIRRLLKSLLIIFGNCCWPRPWDKNGLWPLIRDSAPEPSWSASANRQIA